MSAPGRLHAFRPRLLHCLSGYDFAHMRADLLSGIAVGVVALPLAMAFAIASGLKPEAGLVTSVVAGFLISALGGSRVQIGGPAGAFIVVVYAIVQQYGVLNLAVSTVMAGALLFVMGLTRIGSLVRYIPIAIVIGFTNGIAVLIFLSQMRDFLGLPVSSMPADFFGQARVIGTNFHAVNGTALALSVGCLAALAGWQRFGPRQVPGAIIVLVAATALNAAFGLPIETIGSRFGGIPAGLPAFTPPQWNWSQVHTLIGPVLTIAMLGAIESLLCARVADAATNDRHDSNQELMAQGIANMAAPLFGGMAATGTIARTMTNIRSGGRTPIAGMAHAGTILLAMIVAAPLAFQVPLAALAAILVHVAANMMDWHAFATLRRFSPHYRIIVLATFILTVTVDLTVAVQIGLTLAALFYIVRVASLTSIEPLSSGSLRAPDGVAAFRVQGSLFFGSVSKLDVLQEFIEEERPRVVLLEMSQLINLDTTAMDALANLQRLLKTYGAAMVVCSAPPQPSSLMRRSGFFEALGEDNVLADVSAGMERAATLLRKTA